MATLYVGVGLAILSFNTKFYPYILLSASFSTIILSHVIANRKEMKLFILSIVALAVSLNWFIAELFNEATFFGKVQSLYGYIVAAGLIVIGVWYNLRQSKKEKECKRDARDKYARMIRHTQSMNNKIEKIEKQFDTLTEKLIRLGSN